MPTDETSLLNHFARLEARLEELNIRPRLRKYLTVVQQSKYDVSLEMQKFIQVKIGKALSRETREWLVVLLWLPWMDSICLKDKATSSFIFDEATCCKSCSK
jgi:hypothetical protein